MKSHIKKIAVNPLIAGSFFLFSGGIAANLFNFLFNLFMSRNLSVSDYGVLISLISIITLLSIPAAAVTPTIVSSAGKYFAKNDLEHLHAFYIKMLILFLISGTAIIVVFTAFSSFFSQLLKINNPYLLVIASILVLIGFVLTLNTTFIQAKLSFKTLSVVNTLSSSSKFFLGMLFVLLGTGLFGAMIGLLVSVILPVILSFILLAKVIFFKSDEKIHISLRELISYGLPSAIIVFSLTALISTDILLVKYFYSSQEAGLYAGLSLIGRVIFFVSAPISTVMFPMVISRYTKNENYKGILFTALGLVATISAFITAFYFIFPKFTILFFLKNVQYLEITRYLGVFGIFAAIYSLISVLSYYFLSVQRTKISWILFVGAIVQAILIYFYHADFGQIIAISLSVSSVILIIFLGLLVKDKNTR